MISESESNHSNKKFNAGGEGLGKMMGGDNCADLYGQGLFLGVYLIH